MVELKKILNCKKIIMGIAMIMIMIFHSNIPAFNDNIIKSHLFIGVDIFLFLSGLGIAQSLNKKDGLKEFYKRRFKRIIPISVPLIIVLGYVMFLYDAEYTVTDFYNHSFLIHLLLGTGKMSAFLWYIPAIIVYYLLSPLVFNYYNKSKNKTKATIIIFTIILLSIIITIPRGILINFNFITNRAMIYFIGLLYGIRTIENKNINIWELIFYISMSIVSLAIICYLKNHSFTGANVIKILSFIPISITMCIAVSYGVYYLRNRSFFIQGRVFEYIGTYTLAIYTSHEALLIIVKAICIHYNRFVGFATNPYLYSIVIGIFTIVFAILYTKICNYILAD